MRTRACLFALLLLCLPLSAQPALAGHTPDGDPYAPTKRSGGSITVPASPGSPGGLIKAELVSTVQSCYYKGPPDAQVWTCQVTFMLTLQVPPFTCGEAYSPAAPGYPTERIYACGTVDSLGTYSLATHEVGWPSPGAYLHRTVEDNEVCKSLTGPCFPWNHEYQIPGPHTYQTSAQVNTVSGILYEVVATVMKLIPRQLRVGLSALEGILWPPEAPFAGGAYVAADAAWPAGPGGLLP